MVCCHAVVACAKKLEATQPAAFAELYHMDYSMEHVNVNADGSVIVDGSDPTNIDMKGLTWGATCNYLSFLTGASPALVDVWRQDVIAILAKYAYIRELPQAFLDLMAADLDGPLAADYRVYIRHEIKPVLDRIKDIMHAHYAAIEVPSSEWLMETFAGHSSRISANTIVDSAVSYARAWDGVLAEWDAGRLDVLFPPSYMMPWLAMSKFNNWSKERGETKQHELIGMSNGMKDATSKRLAAFEIEPASE